MDYKRLMVYKIYFRSYLYRLIEVPRRITCENFLVQIYPIFLHMNCAVKSMNFTFEYRHNLLFFSTKHLRISVPAPLFLYIVSY